MTLLYQQFLINFLVNNSSEFRSYLNAFIRETLLRHFGKDALSHYVVHIQGVRKVGLHFSAVARWRVFKCMGKMVKMAAIFLANSNFPPFSSFPGIGFLVESASRLYEHKILQGGPKETPAAHYTTFHQRSLANRVVQNFQKRPFIQSVSWTTCSRLPTWIGSMLLTVVALLPDVLWKLYSVTASAVMVSRKRRRKRRKIKALAMEEKVESSSHEVWYDGEIKCEPCSAGWAKSHSPSDFPSV